MKTRNEKRIEKNLLVYMDNESNDLVGVSSNISKNGVFVESPSPISSNNEIAIILAVDNELYKLKGEVRWFKRPGDKQPEDAPPGMGIKITEAPAEYLNFVEYTKYETA